MKKNIEIFTFLIVFAHSSQIRACRWNEISGHGTQSNYLRFGEYGTCQGVVRGFNQSGGQSLHGEITLFLDGLAINQYKQLVLVCGLTRTGHQIPCQLIKINKEQNKKHGEYSQIFAKIIYIRKQQHNYLSLNIEKIYHRSQQIFQKQVKQVRIQKFGNFQQKFKNSEKIQIIKIVLQYIVIPLLHLLLIIVLVRQPVFITYCFLQQNLVIKLLKQSLSYTFFLSFVHQPNRIYLFSYLILYGVCFVVFMVSCMALINYVWHGCAGLRATSGTSGHFLGDQPTWQDSASSSLYLNGIDLNTDENLNAGIKAPIFNLLKSLNQIKRKIISTCLQKTIKQRVLYLVLAIVYQLFENKIAEIANIVLSSLILFLLPVLITIKNMTPASEIDQTYVKNINSACSVSSYISNSSFNYNFNPNSTSTPLSRSKLLYPKTKITVFFVFQILVLVSRRYLVFLQDSTMWVQCMLILGLWALITKLVFICIIRNIGKGVSILSIEASNSINSIQKDNSITKFYKKLTTLKHCQSSLKNDQTTCSICLQQITIGNTVSLPPPQISISNQINKKNMYIKTQCNHIFHPWCFASWIRHKVICPVDRNFLDAELAARAVALYSQAI